MIFSLIWILVRVGEIGSEIVRRNVTKRSFAFNFIPKCFIETSKFTKLTVT